MKLNISFSTHSKDGKVGLQTKTFENQVAVMVVGITNEMKHFCFLHFRDNFWQET
jgi:hypothetical protein